MLHMVRNPTVYMTAALVLSSRPPAAPWFSLESYLRVCRNCGHQHELHMMVECTGCKA